MLLGGALINRSTRKLGTTSSQVFGLPYEVLEQVALVLGQDQNLRLFDDFAKVADEHSTFGREFLRRVGQWLCFDSRAQSNVNLFILCTTESAKHGRTGKRKNNSLMVLCRWQMLWRVLGQSSPVNYACNVGRQEG